MKPIDVIKMDPTITKAIDTYNLGMEMRGVVEVVLIRDTGGRILMKVNPRCSGGYYIEFHKGSFVSAITNYTNGRK